MAVEASVGEADEVVAMATSADVEVMKTFVVVVGGAPHGICGVATNRGGFGNTCGKERAQAVVHC